MDLRDPTRFHNHAVRNPVGVCMLPSGTVLEMPFIAISFTLPFLDILIQR